MNDYQLGYIDGMAQGEKSAAAVRAERNEMRATLQSWHEAMDGRLEVMEVWRSTFRLLSRTQPIIGPTD